MMKSFTPWAAESFMMCQRIGRPPISVIGFGVRWDSGGIGGPEPAGEQYGFHARRISAAGARPKELSWGKQGPNPAIGIRHPATGIPAPRRGPRGLQQFNQKPPFFPLFPT